MVFHSEDRTPVCSFFTVPRPIGNVVIPGRGFGLHCHDNAQVASPQKVVGGVLISQDATVRAAPLAAGAMVKEESLLPVTAGEGSDLSFP